MDKHYIEIFSLLAQTTANLAKQVRDNNKEEKNIQAAEVMYNNYMNLYHKIEDENQTLDKSDYAHLLVAAIITVNRLENKLKSEQQALEGYKLDVIPKLSQINDASVEEFQKLAEEIFKIKEESNS